MASAPTHLSDNCWVWLYLPLTWGLLLALSHSEETEAHGHHPRKRSTQNLGHLVHGCGLKQFLTSSYPSPGPAACPAEGAISPLNRWGNRGSGLEQTSCSSQCGSPETEADWITLTPPEPGSEGPSSQLPLSWGTASQCRTQLAICHSHPGTF